MDQSISSMLSDGGLQKHLKNQRILARILKGATKKVIAEKKEELKGAQADRIISIPIVGVLTGKTRPEEFAAFVESIK